MQEQVEILYKNAGIEKQTSYYCSFEYGAACPYDNMTCPECPYYKKEDEPQYPPFTAEKQLEVIKWLNISRAVVIKQNTFFIGFESGKIDDLICCENMDAIFEESLAGLINHLWKKTLTESEKEEIRRILE